MPRVSSKPANERARLTDFLLVHGAWHGGWVWERVAQRLRAEGHRPWTPTLLGLGERAAGDRAIDLSAQVNDIADLLHSMSGPAVLCGHSFGGMVITKLADIAPGRVAALVYLDALLPTDGQSASEMLGLSATASDIAPPPAAVFRFANGDDAQMVDRRMTPHPARSFTEPIRLTGAHAQVRPRFYVLSAGFPPRNPQAPFDRAKTCDRLAGDPTWRTVRLECGHHAMYDMPNQVVEILITAAREGAAR